MVSNIAVGSLPYDMGKAALDQFTKVVALELAPHGVRVNTVSPGLTVSNATKTLMKISEEEYQTWLNDTVTVVPMGEACLGLDIARMIVHLASDNSRLVTGAIVQVDGGLQFGSIGNLMIEQMKALSMTK
ncbi:unnamed protein product [Arctia plantaginis]|nr:unnamed protein product [Arctia plantaginis]